MSNKDACKVHADHELEWDSIEDKILKCVKCGLYLKVWRAD